MPPVCISYYDRLGRGSWGWLGRGSCGWLGRGSWRRCCCCCGCWRWCITRTLRTILASIPAAFAPWALPRFVNMFFGLRTPLRAFNDVLLLVLHFFFTLIVIQVVEGRRCRAGCRCCSSCRCG